MQRLQDTERLALMDSVGELYDRMMAESINDLYKAEVILRHGWKNCSAVALVTLVKQSSVVGTIRSYTLD